MGVAHDPAAGRVHVRRLDAVDTVRWSWHVLLAHRELYALAFGVGAAGLAAGHSVARPSTVIPAIGAWPWPVWVGYLFAVVTVLCVSYLTAADAVADRRRPLGRRLYLAARRVPSFVATALLVATATAFGLALLVVPGVYAFTRLELAAPAVVIDGNGPLAAFEEGWRLARGDLWTILGVTLGYACVVLAVEFAAAQVGGEASAARSIAGVAIHAGLAPLFGLALGHLYLQNSHNE